MGPVIIPNEARPSPGLEKQGVHASRWGRAVPLRRGSGLGVWDGEEFYTRLTQAPLGLPIMEVLPAPSCQADWAPFGDNCAVGTLS